jgi:hypothetical protein
MSKLSSLRINECPAALVEFARKHNALVDMIAAMTGNGGIKVTVSENNIIVTGSGDTALLEGYVDTEVELCPVGTVTILTKP